MSLAAGIERERESEAQRTVIADQGATIARLSRNVARLKASRAELVTTFYEAVKDGISELTIPAVPAPPRRAKKRNAEVAVAVLSDWQLGKRTPSYDSQVCAQRITTYADKVIQLTEIQRADHPVNELHVWVLGDIIEGVTVFPGQTWLVDSGLYRQITVDGPRILCDFLRKMLTTFDKVHVTAVIGNHGRLGRPGEYDPESNGDRMLYRICQQLLEHENRLTWNIPDGFGEGNWYAIDAIGDHKTLLIHGDQFRGSSGFPLASVSKKVNGWASGALRHPDTNEPEWFNDVCFGHYHQPTRITLNHVTARCSGSTESHNDFAIQTLASVGRPSQWLLFVNPSKGVTAEYVCWLD